MLGDRVLGKLPWLLIVLLFVSTFLLPDKKMVTNIYRVLVCIPVLFMVNLQDCKVFFKNKQFLLLSVLLLYTALTLLWSPPDKITNILGRLITTMLLVYLFFCLRRYDSSRLKKMPALYLVAGTISIVMILSNWEGLIAIDRWTLPYGVLDHHAPLSWFMAVCFIISIYSYFDSATHKVIYLVMSLLFSVLVFLSQSRGGILMLLLGLLICLYHFNRYKVIKVSLALLIVFLVVSSFFGFDYVLELFARADAGRFVIYENAWHGISLRWFDFVFGHGAGSDTSNMIGSFEADHYHNLYLNTWYLTGLIGLILTLLVMFWRVIFILGKGGNYCLWDVIVVSMLVSFMFDGSRIYAYPSAMMFCFLIPLTLAALNDSDVELRKAIS